MNRAEGAFDVIVDAIFGYSFSGDIRAPYDTIIRSLIAVQSAVPIVAVDIPSGWNVETGVCGSRLLTFTFPLLVFCDVSLTLL